MDYEYLVECIENEEECSFFDFKKDIYDFKNLKEKQDFLIDVLSFANGHSIGDKYLIAGVKLHKDKPREILGINTSKVLDGADYQNFIDDNIEPSLVVDFLLIDYKELKFGVFRINKGNNDQPYMLKKKFGSLEPGFMKIRIGQRNSNFTRRDLDKIYSSKIKEEKSNLVLKGIVNNEVSSFFEVKHINEDLIDDKNLKILEKDIRFLFKKIDDFQITSRTLSHSVPSFFTKFEFEDFIENEINNCAEALKIEKNDHFFSLGGLAESNLGFYRNVDGTNEEKEKYDLIKNLYDKIIMYKGLLNLKKKLNKICYTELLVENIGNKYDDDIHITLKIDNESFVNFLDFPAPSNDIIDKIAEGDYLDRWLKIQRHKDVNYLDAGKKIGPIFPMPTPGAMPGEMFLPEPEAYLDYYRAYIDYLADYECLYNDGYFYLKFVVKKINPNEKIFLPTRLFFKDKIKYIEYEINSKYNPSLKKGVINIVD